MSHDIYHNIIEISLLWTRIQYTVYCIQVSYDDTCKKMLGIG